MNKLLTIILLLTTFTLSQIDKKKYDFVFGEDMESETIIYLASLTTPLSGATAGKIDRVVKRLKAELNITNLSDAFDVIYLFGNETQEAGLKNLVKRSHDATNVNSTTFTAFEGFTGNGSSMYLTTNYNPNTQGVAYTLNSATIGHYNRSEVSAGRSFAAQTTDPAVRINFEARDGGNSTVYSLNSNGDATYSPTTNAQGLWQVTRVASNSILLYKNGLQLSSATTASVGVPSLNIFILARNVNGSPSNYSGSQVAIFYIGKSFTAPQTLLINNIIEEYMDSNDKGVIP